MAGPTSGVTIDQLFPNTSREEIEYPKDEPKGVTLDQLFPKKEATPPPAQDRPFFDQRLGHMVGGTTQENVEAENDRAGKPIAKVVKPGPGEFASFTAFLSNDIKNSIAALAGIPGTLGRNIARGEAALGAGGLSGETPLQHWENMPTAEKDAFAKSNPLSASFADFMSKATKDPVLGQRFFRQILDWGTEAFAGGTGKALKATTGTDLGIKGANESSVVPQTPTEKIAAAAGQGAGEMASLAAGGTVAKTAEGPSAINSVDRMLSTTPAGSALKSVWQEGESFLGETGKTIAGFFEGHGTTSMARTGAAMGAGGEIAAQQTDNEALKGPLRTMGGLGGGGVEALVAQGLKSAATPIISRMGETAEMNAARKMQDAALDQEKYRAGLANADEIVPGSKPTVFQATGDEGVGALEKRESMGEHRPLFDQRANEQHAARVSAMNGIANGDLSSDGITNYLKSRVNEIDAFYDAQQAKTAQEFKEQAGDIGGDRANPAEYGEALMSRLQPIIDNMKAANKKLWSSLDIDNSIPVEINPLQRAANKITDEMTTSAKPIGGEERRIFNVVNSYDGTTSFGELVDLREAITDQIAKTSGKSADRLTRLLRAVDGTLTYKAGAEMAANPNAQRGLYDTLKGEADSWESANAGGPDFGFGNKEGQPIGGMGNDAWLRRARAQDFAQHEQDMLGKFVSDANDARLATTITREQAMSSPIVYAPARQGGPGDLTFVTRSRTKATEMGGGVEPLAFRLKEGSTVYPDNNIHSGRKTLLQGDQSKSMGVMRTSDLEPHVGLDRGVPEGVAQRYGLAKQSDQDIAEVEQGPVGTAMGKTQSDVAPNLFDRPEDLQATLDAAGRGTPAQRQSVVDELSDYAAFDFRKSVMRDGLVSPAKYQRWMDDHAHVFDAFPELKEKFGNLKAAQDSMDAAVSARRAAMDDESTKALKQALGGRNPKDVVASVINNPQQYGEIIDAIKKGDPGKVEDLMSSLRSATAEHIVDKAVTSNGTINVETLAKLLRNARPSLEQAFSKEELASMENVVLDANRSRMSTTVGRAGGPPPSDVPNVPRTILGALLRKTVYGAIGAVAGEHIGEQTIGALVGFLSGMTVERVAANSALAQKRALATVLLNPEIAHEMTTKINLRDAGAINVAARKIKGIIAAQTAGDDGNPSNR